MSSKILVLPGDGIGPEVIRAAISVLDAISLSASLDLTTQYGLIGGAAIDAVGDPLPEETLRAARAADAVLFGAIGGPKWDRNPRGMRPETGLLRLRSELGVFCNLRPALLFPELINASTLKPEVVRGLDILIVRELVSGLYFGKPRGIAKDDSGQRFGFNTMRYAEGEISRIAHIAFDLARQRRGNLVSVDKANVLEVMELWREVVTDVGHLYPSVRLEHMYVDNAAMQLVRSPCQFDVLLTSNLFGDILSDLASMLTGSIGMLPSAAVDANGKGLYEPIHGSAPDLAGTDRANPLATILSVAMLFRHSLHLPHQASRIEHAVADVLRLGLRTADIATPDSDLVGTAAMGRAVAARLLA
jgi:3-isopropylmalate dehydrogenase